MPVSGLIDVAVVLVALLAIGGGVACAVSGAWAAVVVGVILLALVVVSRLRPGGKTE